ncbi:major facilitator superfamily transporter [Grosmannia clavigera kw1407]|uniref:Major facilitator superfamily transporter n=1 Tax=Grosmannia clavigera (strain kw1407 / UAMH 11150) TaxID=655863 RepID=F0XH98_GROCL|nr:major facilitator superfamily transporter [Grosmannia clavigera kw1407]EFX03273.1 major facilitator superfamily transporter [Grosmannia clavigera kw1407]
MLRPQDWTSRRLGRRAEDGRIRHATLAAGRMAVSAKCSGLWTFCPLSALADWRLIGLFSHLFAAYDMATHKTGDDAELSDSVEMAAAAAADGQQQRTWRQRVLAVVWDSLDKPAVERRLVAKLDWILLSYVCLAYFVKYLDQTNVANAYVSGMKEELGLGGNDLNLLTTVWTAGYVVGQVPSQLVMTRVPARLWLPALELGWSAGTAAVAGARDRHVILGLRFVIGLLEASAYPGVMTLLGSWYRPEELAKRACLFQASSSVAQMVGGYVQAGLYAHLDGARGLAAWRWLFVLDGLLGLPVALYGFVAVPDSPSTTRAYWLRPAERASTLQSLANLFREWPVYLFTASFVCYIQATRVYAYFGVWLKATHRFSVEQVNEIPTAGFGFLVVCTLLAAWTSDGLQARWPVVVALASVSFVGAVVLAVSVHRPADSQNWGAVVAGFLLTYVTTASAGIYMAYMSEVFAYNGLHRAVAIALADTVAYVFVAWLPLVVFDAAEAPYFAVGYTVTAVFLVLQIGTILLVPVARRRWPVGQYEEGCADSEAVVVHSKTTV